MPARDRRRVDDVLRPLKLRCNSDRRHTAFAKVLDVTGGNDLDEKAARLVCILEYSHMVSQRRSC